MRSCPNAPATASKPPRARGRTGGQKPKLTSRQAKIAQAMYDELGPDDKRAHTVQQIATEFGVARPTITATFSVRPADRDAVGYLALGATFLNGTPS